MTAKTVAMPDALAIGLVNRQIDVPALPQAMQFARADTTFATALINVWTLVKIAGGVFPIDKTAARL